MKKKFRNSETQNFQDATVGCQLSVKIAHGVKKRKLKITFNFQLSIFNLFYIFCNVCVWLKFNRLRTIFEYNHFLAALQCDFVAFNPKC